MVKKMSEIGIGKATSNDIESLIDLYEEMEIYIRRISSDPLFTLSSNWRELTRRYFVEFSEGDDMLVLVARKGKDIVGFLTAMITTPLPIFAQRKYGSLNDMFVKKEHRGKDIGKKLLQTAIEWFEQNRIHRIELRVDAKNKGAIAFYKAHDFKIRGHAMKRES